MTVSRATGTSLSDPVNKNPFTYRGYYYDSELRLYYLQTRYYDPLFKRFLSPDNSDVLTATPGALTDKNLYAYCDNNPVMRADHGGEFWHLVIGSAVGAVAGALSSAFSQLLDDGTVNFGSVVVSAAAGAVSGLLAVTPLGTVVQMAANTVVSGAESILTQGIENGFNEVDYTQVVIDSTLGAITSRKNGITKGDSKHLMKQGLNTVKNYRGFSKTAKYYFSQTYTIIYDEKIFKKVAKDIAFSVFSSAGKYSYRKAMGR